MIVLASKSPRRQELLRKVGLRFEVCPSRCDEKITGNRPDEIVVSLAEQKARDVARLYGEEDIILSADTLVFLDGEALGKPADEKEAHAMLRRLSGRDHEVYTGVVLMRGAQIQKAYERTKVFFKPLDDKQIKAYIRTGEPMDKAGAYGAQGIGSLLVRKIEGDYFNVVGLPMQLVHTMFSRWGIELLEERKAEQECGTSYETD